MMLVVRLYIACRLRSAYTYTNLSGYLRSKLGYRDVKMRQLQFWLLMLPPVHVRIDLKIMLLLESTTEQLIQYLTEFR